MLLPGRDTFDRFEGFLSSSSFFKLFHCRSFTSQRRSYRTFGWIFKYFLHASYTSRNSDKWLEGVERGWRSEICTRVKRTEGRRVVIGRRGGSIKKSISPFHDWTRGERPGERRAGRGTTSR